MRSKSWKEFHEANPFVLETIQQKIGAETTSFEDNLVYHDGEKDPIWSLLLKEDFYSELVFVRSLVVDSENFVIRPQEPKVNFNVL